MTTATLTLTDFLSARYDDDEAVARAAVGSSALGWQQDRYRVTFDSEWEVAEANVQTAAHIARHDPARVLADVAAKRAVVERVQMSRNDRGMDGMAHPAIGDSTANAILRALAAPYAEHADFRAEWLA